MNYKELTSPCGIDCFNCNLFESNITEDVKNMMMKATGKSSDEVSCKGCRKQGGCKLFSSNCTTLDCVNEKGVQFCFECSEFPCNKLLPCADGSQKYPHNLKVYNLSKIKNIGLDNWVKEAKIIRGKYFMGKFQVGNEPKLD